MKIKNANVMDDDFIAAFDELLKKEMPAKQCLEMVQCVEILINKYQILKKTQLTIVKKYSNLTKEGNVIFKADGKVSFKSDADEKKCNDEITEIRNESVDIPLTNKVKIYEDEVITPRKLILLTDMIDIVERPAPAASPEPVK